MKLLSLFAGVGGFDLGFEAEGFHTAAQCEIDPWASEVLARHWPDVPRHPDVTTLQPSDIGGCDVVTFGSPCQDLSLAGSRSGVRFASVEEYLERKVWLAALFLAIDDTSSIPVVAYLVRALDEFTRSGLFFEAVRIIRRMREETDGRLPRVAVWENVPGALSSNGGRDFAAVLASLVGGSVRVPADGWWDAGVAFGPRGGAEWRVLDSQHFGVPQRRRRIFLVYHPGERRAGQVLFEPNGLQGDPAPRQEAREDITGTLEARSTAGGFPGTDGAIAGHVVPVAFRPGAHGAYVEGVGPLRAQGGDAGGGSEALIPRISHTLTAPSTPRFDAETETLIPDHAPSVLASWGHHGRSSPRGDGSDPLVPIAFTSKDHGQDAGHVSPTLRAMENRHSAPNGGGQVAVAFNWLAGEREGMTAGDPTPPLRSQHGGHMAALTFEPRHFLRDQRGGAPLTEAVRTVTGRGRGDIAQHVARAGYAVRRLTPRETERLQGFPDDWTRYAADGREIADGNRYRMMGNAVTVNVTRWLARRIREALA